MEIGSQRTGMTAWEIADLYADAFREDLERLNVLEPTVWCKATDHIAEQIALVQCIEARGLAYSTSDGIYFDTSRLDDYGRMARLDVEGLQAGARVAVGEKRRPTDFALWKFSPPGSTRQMEWDSPWGVGFPGWHVECSAMSAKYLGPLFDIHCGGEDHIPVHHTNEIAQTQACYGTRLANFWMHGYFLMIDAERMAKSSGEFLRLQALIDRGYDPLAYRFFCLNAHYRSKLAFSWTSLNAATRALDRLRSAFHGWEEPGAVDEGYQARFEAELNNDLNMPRALAVAWELVKSDLPGPAKKATLLDFDQVLGLGLAGWQPPEACIPDRVMELVAQRQTARAERDWSRADALREAIRDAGFKVKDTPGGPQVQAR
jgi:cysteinyl-tRNA synthetase